jgi:hypothetical protein
MFEVFNPYDEDNQKAERRRNKFINFDDSIKNWLGFCIKKIANLKPLRYMAFIVLATFLLMQLAPVIKSLPVGAQDGPLGHWVISDPGDQVAGAPFNINVTPCDSTGEIITGYDWGNPANRPSFSGLLTSPFGNAPVDKFLSATNGVATYEVTTYAAQTGAQITATGGETPGATGTNPSPFNVSHSLTIAGITITPDPYTATAGDSVTYACNAHDPYGNPWDVTSGTTFSIVEPGHGGHWTDNVYTTHTVGTWTVRGSYSGFNDDATLNVIHAEAESIEVSPGPYTATVGDIITYTSQAIDAYSNTWNATAETNFTIDVAAGGSWAANIYTSEEAGNWTVTGTYKPNPSITGTAFLYVNPTVPAPPSPTAPPKGAVAGAEIGIASAIGPGGTPEVLAAETKEKKPGFSETIGFPSLFSAAGCPPYEATDWARNLGILLIVLGSLVLLSSFLVLYVELTKPSEIIQKRR